MSLSLGHHRKMEIFIIAKKNRLCFTFEVTIKS